MFWSAGPRGGCRVAPSQLKCDPLGSPTGDLLILDPLQAKPDYAEEQFAFLDGLGFRQIERWASGGQSFKDGWRLIYRSGLVQISIEYLDVQFDVCFVRDGVAVSYFTLDRDMFGRRSGFHGNMFPPEKLRDAIDRVASDIREHYGPILDGSDDPWTRIAQIVDQPRPKPQLPEPLSN
jgi:hypothetical protein